MEKDYIQEDVIRCHSLIRRPRIGLIMGTRPECLKLISVATSLSNYGYSDHELLLINSGQHQAMVECSLAQLGLAAHITLPQCNDDPLPVKVQAIRYSIRACLHQCGVRVVVAQGDTITTYATALAAHDLGLPFAHVEAGLRTDDPQNPFPEEVFRRQITRLSDMHFAPTAIAESNLLAEAVPPERIHRVGQTSIDILRGFLQRSCPHHELPPLPVAERLIVLAMHRRENYRSGIDIVCNAITTLLGARPDIGVLCPLHPNPTFSSRIFQYLSSHPRIKLTGPLNFHPFITVLACASLAITDSGGIQEEAPYLGTRVLLVRANTERQETMNVGIANLVPIDVSSIVAEAGRLLDLPPPTKFPFNMQSPYGDGRSGARVAQTLINFSKEMGAP